MQYLFFFPWLKLQPTEIKKKGRRSEWLVPSSKLTISLLNREKNKSNRSGARDQAWWKENRWLLLPLLFRTRCCSGVLMVPGTMAPACVGCSWRRRLAEGMLGTIDDGAGERSRGGGGSEALRWRRGASDAGCLRSRMRWPELGRRPGAWVLCCCIAWSIRISKEWMEGLVRNFLPCTVKHFRGPFLSLSEMNFWKKRR
jgi:hypothetical protein